MKKFSTKWKKSKKAKKQRKYLANAPLHLKRKFLTSNLSKELSKKYSRKSFPVKKGDTVKIMRGGFKGKSGKITEVQIKNSRVAVEKVQKKKKDGTKINVYFHPSNLRIIQLNLDDKKRETILKKQKSEKKSEKAKNKSKKKSKKSKSKKSKSKVKKNVSKKK